MIETIGSADFLIRHSHGDIESIKYHIRSQQKAIENLRKNGRLAEIKRNNIAVLQAELKRLEAIKMEPLPSRCEAKGWIAE
ncbi:hypothetical protein [Teredinibacter purpureus]|uniref:hypothetical protein n=1 Tax=Teredinibacter purpureus TaxID=2731756 RepID=UPI0005F7E1B8|nr:hypothetical protein [Teredinibacter purpureus]